MSQFDLTTLEDFKDFIRKDSSNTDQDDVIKKMITKSSLRMESYCRRKFRARTLVDYYDGEGYDTLFVDDFPIISVTSLYDDSTRAWASTTLKAATDYAILSGEGEIKLLPTAVKGSTFAKGIQNIKLTYVAGYDEFVVTEDVNDAIDFKENSGAEKNATLDPGTYTANELATEIKTQMDDAGDYVYTVTHDKISGKFKIASTGTSLLLMCNTGTYAYKGAYDMLGWDTDNDATNTNPVEADFGVLGIPQDLVNACNLLTLRLYNDSGLGGDRFDLAKKDTTTGSSSGSTTEFVGGEMPPEVASILLKYLKELS